MQSKLLHALITKQGANLFVACSVKNGTNTFIVGDSLTALITSSYHICIVGKAAAEEAFGSEEG